MGDNQRMHDLASCDLKSLTVSWMRRYRDKFSRDYHSTGHKYVFTARTFNQTASKKYAK